MLAADVLNAEVLGPDGSRVGRVLDIRTRPVDGSLVVDGLIVGRTRIRLFGYERGGEVGPSLFTRLAAFVHRATRYAPMSELDLDLPGTIRLHRRWNELPGIETLD